MNKTAESRGEAGGGDAGAVGQSQSSAAPVGDGAGRGYTHRRGPIHDARFSDYLATRMQPHRPLRRRRRIQRNKALLMLVLALLALVWVVMRFL